MNPINHETIEKELIWTKNILENKLLTTSPENILPPTIAENDTSFYADIVREYQLSVEERMVFALALIPHFMPHWLDFLLEINPKTGLSYTVLGGSTRNRNHQSFIPTGETALFLLGGLELSERLKHYSLFDQEENLAKHDLVHLEETEDEPFLSGELKVSQPVIDRLITGKAKPPKFSNAFPAEKISTQLDWDDLILEHTTLRQLEEIETWLTYKDELMNVWGMSKKMKAGYRVIFHGPPGTGKSFTAALLGKKTGKDVYRVDLSKVVSKYIGETEKNLSNVFRQAEHKDWILFFDEADALFGKRTNVNTSNDRYANQEVSYLLQRIENYNGLIILASNLKGNMDVAFMRRFQSDIYFPLPKAAERLKIWQHSFSAKATFHETVDWNKIAHNYELAGGSIMNVVQFCSLRALKRNSTEINLNDFIDGIRKEFHKEGKVL